jgi:hypothetical protein
MSIPLQNGGHAKVDECDLWIADVGVWRGISRHGRIAAACRPYGNGGRHVYMHRYILGMGIGDRRTVDHINGDPLDNRRSNLRICTRHENMANRGPGIRNNSGFKGVYLNQIKTRWNAEIRAKGGHKHIGCFATAEEAARAYDTAARAIHGEFAYLNFPETPHDK